MKAELGHHECRPARRHPIFFESSQYSSPYKRLCCFIRVHYRAAPSPALPPRPLSIFPPPPDMAARAPARLAHLAHQCLSRSGAEALGLRGGGFSASPAAPSTRRARYATASASKGGGDGGGERDVEVQLGVEPARYIISIQPSFLSRC